MVIWKETVGPLKKLSQTCSGVVGKTTKLQREDMFPIPEPKTTTQISMQYARIFILTVKE